MAFELSWPPACQFKMRQSDLPSEVYTPLHGRIVHSKSVLGNSIVNCKADPIVLLDKQLVHHIRYSFHAYDNTSFWLFNYANEVSTSRYSN